MRFGAGDGEAGVFSAKRGEKDAWLLLASHGRLLQVNYVNGDVRVVHEGKVRICCIPGFTVSVTVIAHFDQFGRKNRSFPTFQSHARW